MTEAPEVLKKEDASKVKEREKLEQLYSLRPLQNTV